MNEFIKIDSWILALGEDSFTKLLLYEDGRHDSETNKIILASINFIYCSKCYDGQLI